MLNCCLARICLTIGDGNARARWFVCHVFVTHAPWEGLRMPSVKFFVIDVNTRMMWRVRRRALCVK